MRLGSILDHRLTSFAVTDYELANPAKGWNLKSNLPRSSRHLQATDM